MSKCNHKMLSQHPFEALKWCMTQQLYISIVLCHVQVSVMLTQHLHPDLTHLSHHVTLLLSHIWWLSILKIFWKKEEKICVIITHFSKDHLACDSLSQIFNCRFLVTEVIPIGGKIVRPSIVRCIPGGQSDFENHLGHLAHANTCLVHWWHWIICWRLQHLTCPDIPWTFKFA